VSTARRTSSSILSVSYDRNREFAYWASAGKNNLIHDQRSNNSILGDGLAYLWDAKENTLVVDLVGSEFDPIYSVKSGRAATFTAARDGKIRKYHISE
jgi:hypothetical protein